MRIRAPCWMNTRLEQLMTWKKSIPTGSPKSPEQKWGWEHSDLQVSPLRAPHTAAAKYFITSTSTYLNYLLQNKHHFKWNTWKTSQRLWDPYKITHRLLWPKFSLISKKHKSSPEYVSYCVPKCFNCFPKMRPGLSNLEFYFFKSQAWQAFEMLSFGPT